MLNRIVSCAAPCYTTSRSDASAEGLNINMLPFPCERYCKRHEIYPGHSNANALLNTISLMISTSVTFRRATDQGTLFIIIYNERLADSEETTVQLHFANANARPLVHI